MNLHGIVSTLRTFSGITRKRAIGEILNGLSGVTDFGRTVVGPGDDAAVLAACSDRYLLLATDGIVPALIRKAPREAGRASVLVNANDVYAMGGRPLAMVNTIAGLSGADLKEVIAGIREECLRLRIPMVGGHLLPEQESLCVVVSVVGEAKEVVKGTTARPGQEVLLAVDLDGRRWGDFIFNWDSHYKKSSEKICSDLEVMVSLAEDGLCCAARDVSMCGIMGTVAMLLEASGVGGTVDLDAFEVPEEVGLEDWLRMYPSYGFVLSVDPRHVEECIARFLCRNIWARSIGRVEAERRLCLSSGDAREVLYDFTRDVLLYSALPQGV